MRKEFKDALSQAFIECIHQAYLFKVDSYIFAQANWQNRSTSYDQLGACSFQAAGTLFHLCEDRGANTRLPTGDDVSNLFTSHQADLSSYLDTLSESLARDSRYDFPDYWDGTILLDAQKKARDTLNSLILAAAWALKEHDRQVSFAMLGFDSILGSAAASMCYTEEDTTGAYNPNLVLFIPDNPADYTMSGSLADMAEEMTASLQPGRIPIMPNIPELTFFHMECQPGRCEIAMLGKGKMVKCNSDEAQEYVAKQVDKWIDRLRRENPY